MAAEPGAGAAEPEAVASSAASVALDTEMLLVFPAPYGATVTGCCRLSRKASARKFAAGGKTMPQRAPTPVGTEPSAVTATRPGDSPALRRAARVSQAA